MRFSLLDLLFPVGCIGIGAAVGASFASGLPANGRLFAGAVIGIGLYLALIYPVYRGLKLFPMILPRCPCCASFQDGFHILGGTYPRITFRCPTCNGEFVVWHNGKPGDEETWEHPVLALKWPYALGRYQTMQKPEQSVLPKDSLTMSRHTNPNAADSLDQRAKRAKLERFDQLLAKVPDVEPIDGDKL